MTARRVRRAGGEDAPPSPAPRCYELLRVAEILRRHRTSAGSADREDDHRFVADDEHRSVSPPGVDPEQEVAHVLAEMPPLVGEPARERGRPEPSDRPPEPGGEACRRVPRGRGERSRQPVEVGLGAGRQHDSIRHCGTGRPYFRQRSRRTSSAGLVLPASRSAKPSRIASTVSNTTPLILQRKQFDLLVPGLPGLGVRPTCDLISANVILHQQQGRPQ